jgi:hypothetical protein
MITTQLKVATACAVLALAGGVTACGSAPAAPRPAVTVTHTVAPHRHHHHHPPAAAAAPAAPAAPAPVPAQPAPPVVTDPWAVVSAYYGDVTSGDYAGAWQLLGPGMQASQGSYSSFVAGYTGTGAQQVSEVSEDTATGTVSYYLESVNPDGTTQWYSATAAVSGGQLQSAAVTQLAGNPQA